jgi:hypothetical protein
MLMLTWPAAKAGAAIMPRTARLCLAMFMQGADSRYLKIAASRHAAQS